jgi:hypothetical protein
MPPPPAATRIGPCLALSPSAGRTSGHHYGPDPGRRHCPSGGGLGGPVPDRAGRRPGHGGAAASARPAGGRGGHDEEAHPRHRAPRLRQDGPAGPVGGRPPGPAGRVGDGRGGRRRRSLRPAPVCGAELSRRPFPGLPPRPRPRQRAATGPGVHCRPPCRRRRDAAHGGGDRRLPRPGQRSAAGRRRRPHRARAAEPALRPRGADGPAAPLSPAPAGGRAGRGPSGGPPLRDGRHPGAGRPHRPPPPVRPPARAAPRPHRGMVRRDQARRAVTSAGTRCGRVPRRLRR